MIRKGDGEDESDNDGGGDFDSNNGDWNNTIPNDLIKNCNSIKLRVLMMTYRMLIILTTKKLEIKMLTLN